MMRPTTYDNDSFFLFFSDTGSRCISKVLVEFDINTNELGQFECPSSCLIIPSFHVLQVTPEQNNPLFSQPHGSQRSYSRSLLVITWNLVCQLQMPQAVNVDGECCFQQPECPQTDTLIDQNSHGVNLSSHPQRTNNIEYLQPMRSPPLSKSVPRFGCSPPILAMLFLLSAHDLDGRHAVRRKKLAPNRPLNTGYSPLSGERDVKIRADGPFMPFMFSYYSISTSHSCVTGDVWDPGSKIFHIFIQ